MKIGIIYTAFNTDEYFARSLASWVEARRTRLGGHHFVIAAVSVPFVGFETSQVDSTCSRMKREQGEGTIDHLIVDRSPMPETQARGEALKWLVAAGTDCTIMVDSDEFWTIEQIASILDFVIKNPFIIWFKVSYKNRVFTKDQYLVEPFTPPRIHRSYFEGITASGFWDDNNVIYNIEQGDQIRDIELPSLTIPISVAWVDHYTWISDSRSKEKVQYQMRRWGQSSFSWEDSRGGLIFNEAYYKARGQPLPEVAKDSG